VLVVDCCFGKAWEFDVLSASLSVLFASLVECQTYQPTPPRINTITRISKPSIVLKPLVFEFVVIVVTL
jgi:hypothetical protein